MCYLNVMAGPLRERRFVPDPNVPWIMERDG
jgi:5-deoxy-glucuronate isomerase